MEKIDCPWLYRVQDERSRSPPEIVENFQLNEKNNVHLGAQEYNVPAAIAYDQKMVVAV